MYMRESIQRTMSSGPGGPHHDPNQLLQCDLAGSDDQDNPSDANSIRVVHTTLGEVLRSRLHPGTVPNGRMMTVQMPPTTPLAAEKQQQHGRSADAMSMAALTSSAVPSPVPAPKLQPPSAERHPRQFMQGLLAAAPHD